MNWQERSKSSVDYGRKLLDSGVEGARNGQEEFLHGEPVAPFLGESLRKALKPAALGACLGVLGSYPGKRPTTASRVFAFGLVGAAIGFSTGVVWESRRLGASVISGALKSICRVRDEHWLESHPIDYA